MKLASLSKIIILPVLFLLCYCKNDPKSPTPKALVELTKFGFSQPHLGTTVQIVFYTEQSEEATQLSQKCFQRIRDLNAVFSDYLDDSELNKLCQKPINVAHKVSEPLFTVIAQAQIISSKTSGAFDITLGKHTKRWRDRSPKEQLDQVNYLHLKLDPVQQTITLLKPLSIDLGGIAKGYIADQVMLILKDADIRQAAVIIGGETVLADAPPGKEGWKIGIEDPEHQIIGTLVLANTCLSTSGDSYQFFEQDGERQAHIIDPATKQGVHDRLNVTTIAPSSMQADAWATALRILPSDEALTIVNKQDHIEALFIPYRKEKTQSNQFPKLHNLHN